MMQKSPGRFAQQITIARDKGETAELPAFGLTNQEQCETSNDWPQRCVPKFVVAGCCAKIRHTVCVWMQLSADCGQWQLRDVCCKAKAPAYGIEQVAENGKSEAHLAFLPQGVSDQQGFPDGRCLR